MPQEPADDIVDATYRALCTHGYTDLTMQAIADECDKSKAALHYHFDSKQELLETFLSHLLDDFEEHLADVEGDDPVERLFALVDTMLVEPSAEEDAPDAEFKTAVLELKAQAPYEPVYRERLTLFDERLRDRIEELVADGIEAGLVVPERDPEDVATFVKTYLTGAQTRFVATGAPFEESRRLLHEYIRTELLVEGVDVKESGEVTA
ncbi:transcriptional regulator, TetR family [Halogranum gelatinilyticum]|uniref:Transcriptional regulator, TetR family n=1 Tax=Halogranum gelatinilyticum TaxID=660521 RepID=A0A1G9XFS7_9EURY|nr:TetR/AcrR family transcriptional regulator [Halogranum gelatinilyticum]SDM95692.1 transcriptional regulator, TetR family [Halogranum gelatinilyticum]